MPLDKKLTINWSNIMLKKYLNTFDGFNLIDIGSSGGLDKIWKPYKSFINLIGFDPNEEECKRMSCLPSGFRTAKYIPYAISGSSGENILYKTKSIYCYSLLKPNKEWLDRFTFSDLFEITGQEKIQTRTLKEIKELKGLEVDIIKTDTQGLELPILKNAGEFLEKAFYVETETGFVENYIGETTYAQIDEFMRSQGFILFDINTSHRISRKNNFSKEKTNAEQILWCEAVWLKDYVALSKRDINIIRRLSKDKILKILLICSIHGCLDYGYELAQLFNEFGFFAKDEFNSLSDKSAWDLHVDKKEQIKPDSVLTYLFRLLPQKIRMYFYDSVSKSIYKKNLLKF